MKLEQEYQDLKNQGTDTHETATEVAVKLTKWAMDFDLRSRLFGTMGGREGPAVYQRMQAEMVRLNVELKWAREVLALKFNLDLEQIYQQLRAK